MTRYTSADVERKIGLVNERLVAAGQPPMVLYSTSPDGSQRRYEFAGGVYKGAAEACRALDAVLYVLRMLDLTERQSAYISRAIDVARSDSEAAALLDPVERDELQKVSGGRR